MNKELYIIKSCTDCVEVFSKHRIPFEVKSTDKTYAFKQDLLSELKKLTVIENGILSARYGSTASTNEKYDLENILFYNLGTSFFSNITKNGLIFTSVPQNEIEYKRAAFNLSNEYIHYYEYRIITDSIIPKSNVELASFMNLNFYTFRGLTPLKVWQTMHKELRSIIVKNKINVNQGHTFGIDLIVEKPKNQIFNIATAMKPLLDGLICTFHGGDFAGEKQTDFSKLLYCENEDLLNNELNVLGNYPYILKYGRAKNGIKWNPADDKCSFVRIVIKNGAEWTLSGKIYESISCPYCGEFNVAHLIYGMPAWNEELDKQEREGKIEIMGCCIEDKIYNFRCRHCNRKF